MLADGRWSMNYDKCQSCGTTSIKHEARGLCRHCYVKLPMIRTYRRNFVRAGAEKYNAMTKANHFKDRFGSKTKRDEAFALYGDRCIDCGISREENKRKTGKDLGIFHVDFNLKNNNIDNLRPICVACHATRI